MIDFRYHLVSIVAVFLALSVGIVLGSTELRGAALTALEHTSSVVSAKLNAANNENSALQQEISGDRSFAQAAEPVLLARLLDGKRVVVITAPGAPNSVVNGVTTALGDAGATVSGQVDLSAKFADTSASNLSLLDELTQRVAPSGLTLANGTPQQQAAQVLASALVSTGSSSGSGSGGSGGSGASGSPSVSSQAAQTILSSYSAGQFITVSGQPAQGATLAVIVAPASVPAAGDSDPADQAIVSLAQEFGSASEATVVAGPSAESGPGSAISAIRSSGAAASVSTIDNADQVIGQTVVVQALQQQLAGHKPGNYGTQSDANSAGPSPAPTPAPTPSGSASASTRSTTPAKGKK